MSNKYYLFYSNKCQISKECLKMLTESNLFLKKLCIDNSDSNYILGAGITHVPCLYDRLTNDKIYGTSVIRVLGLLINQVSNHGDNRTNMQIKPNIIKRVEWSNPSTKSVLSKNIERKNVIRELPKTNSVLHNKNLNTNTNNLENAKVNNQVNNQGNNQVNNQGNNQVNNKHNEVKKIDSDFESMFQFSNTDLDFTIIEDGGLPESNWENLENNTPANTPANTPVNTPANTPVNTPNHPPEPANTRFSRNDNVSEKSNNDFDKRMEVMMEERNSLLGNK